MSRKTDNPTNLLRNQTVEEREPMPNDDESIHHPLSYRDAVDILKLVKDSEHCASLDIRIGDMKLSLTRAGAADPAPATPTAPRSMPPASASDRKSVV